MSEPIEVEGNRSQNGFGETSTSLKLEEESDDEEPVQGIEYDITYTYDNLRKTVRKENLEPEPFRFYEFGLHPVGFQDLLKSIKTMRQVTTTQQANTRPFLHRSQTAPSSPNRKSPGNRKKTRTFDIRAYQKAIDLQKSLPTSSKQYHISAFHPKTPKWDGSHLPNQELLKDLYRIPVRDPTGKVIFNLLRDDGKLPEGQVTWKPTDTSKDLPEPTFEQCHVTFQKQAIKHLVEAIEKVEEEYLKMPEKTQEQSTLRAKVGADLNNLKLEKQRLIEKIQNNPELMEHHKEFLNLVNNANSNSPQKGSRRH